jgi:hypothetical protein
MLPMGPTSYLSRDDPQAAPGRLRATHAAVVYRLEENSYPKSQGGSDVSRSVTGGAPPGSRYVDQRHYVVAARLADLQGPISGTVTLDRWLDWSGDSTYDLDNAGDLQLMYQTVLNQATTVADLCRWLDGDTLRRLWPSLWLPGRLRALWQARIPELAAPPEAIAG